MILILPLINLIVVCWYTHEKKDICSPGNAYYISLLFFATPQLHSGESSRCTRNSRYTVSILSLENLAGSTLRVSENNLRDRLLSRCDLILYNNI